MTSTNTFQGMDTSAKPSSRVLKPPGGGSSNLFGGDDSAASSASRPQKMASNIFAPVEETQSSPRRTNPPGGKSSGIFGESEAPAPKATPPSGVTSNIFVEPPSNPPAVRSYPNKPKDNIGVNALPQPEAPKEKTPAHKEDVVPSPKQETDQPSNEPVEDTHEPRLGPRPRSHNKVIHPPGGKSSVVLY
ncbi:hematological and neurological expressed 1-like protein-like [Scleropages formosus]|uniref:Hematological and neurological expressed 1-like protein-like n=1 Tax=Scleropages formosus TaxID=113540 RepID=A0A0P7UB14_SCLFO|nr:hematological and neurological expressed 1-like protein-like [Scleropages formosus]